MTDESITKRLRGRVVWEPQPGTKSPWDDTPFEFEVPDPLCHEAAAEIERLQAALREAKELLEHGRSVNVAITIIRAALSGKGES